MSLSTFLSISLQFGLELNIPENFLTAVFLSDVSSHHCPAFLDEAA